MMNMRSSQAGTSAPHLTPSFSAGSTVASRPSSSGPDAQASGVAAIAPAKNHGYPRRSAETPEPSAQGHGEPHLKSHESRFSPRTERRKAGVIRRADACEDWKEAGTHVPAQSRHSCPTFRRLATPVDHAEEWCKSVHTQRVLEDLCGVWDRRVRGKNVCGLEQLRTRRELMLAMRHIASYVWYQDEERRGAWKR